jgi:magnesium chelatase subunit D
MVDLASDKKLSPSGVGFDAVVGQEELKEALLAVAADDSLSGLLIQGEKGTAKSTAVRGLVDLLPEQQAVADCPFGCPPDAFEGQCAGCRDREDPPVETRRVPLVTLPLGATRERVVGSLSVADALSGDPEFDPGLLARANRGVLYVDEVNLLDDHLVDVLLDAAASGVNRVERDAVSVSHPAEFTLIGTMNPEEGDLRPQLRDRFALRASVAGSDDLEERVTIIDRALGADEGHEDGAEATERSRDRLLAARDRLEAGEVALPEGVKREIAELCRDAGVDGHRADIATARGARTFAALDDRPTVLESDVRRAAALALPHRLQSRPFEDAPDPEDVLDDHFEDGDATDAGNGEDQEDDDDGEEGAEGAEDPTDAGDDPDGAGTDGSDGEADDRPESADDPDGGGSDDCESDDGGAPDPGTGSASTDRDGGDAGEDGDGDDGGSDDPEEGTPLIPGQERAGIGDAAAPGLDPDGPDRASSDGGRNGGSRAHAAPSARGDGPRVRTERADPDEPIDAAASVRAAASRGADRVESRDLRRSVRADDRSALVVFALDASASMRGPMRAAKGVVMELLRDAYEGRDEVSVVAFAGDDGEVLLPPTDSVTMAARHLKELPTADRTPLPAGLRTAGEVLERADPAVGVVVLVTDGRANAGNGRPTAETRDAAGRLAELDAHVVVVDAGDPDDRATLTDEIVRTTGGDRVALSALSAERVEAALANAHERG